MKNRIIKTVSLIAVTLCLVLAFGGCASDNAYYGGQEPYYSNDFYSKEGEEKVVDVSNSKKTLVTTDIDFNVRHGEVKDALEDLKDDIEDFGGVVLYEHHSTNANSKSYYYATVTVKIPSDKAEKFIDEIDDDNEITYKNESIYDVTNQYNDAKARLEKLEKDIAVYTGFYDPETDKSDPSATVADKIAVMEKLDPLLKEKAELEKQVAPYEVSSSYSRITVNIYETDYSGYVFLGIAVLFVLGITACVIIVIVHSVRKRNKNKAIKF